MASEYYCGISDVIATGFSMKTVIEMTDDNDAGVVDMDVLNGCFKDAKDIINPFVSQRYSEKMPFSEVPGIIRTIAAALTRYFLFVRRDSVDETLERYYHRQIKLLDKIAEGKIKLFKGSGVVKKNSIRWKAKDASFRYFKLGMKGF